MNKLPTVPTVYIAREYLLTDNFGGIRIDEEAIFATFEQARAFLRTLEDENATRNDLILFRTEIVEFQLDTSESYSKKWTYDLRGVEIEGASLYDVGISESTIQNNQRSYQVGDIVCILPNIESKFSPSIKGDYGVICEVPGEQNNSEYIVYYITENGYLDHFHVPEKSIIAQKGNLPTTHIFLDLFSKHLKREHKLDDKLVYKLINENVFVMNVSSFDFQTETII